MINKAQSLYHLLIRKLAVIFFKGNNVYCPLCEWRGRAFLNKRCPRCSSLPRTRLIPFSVKYFDIDIQNLGSVLHCSPNPAEFHWASRLHVGHPLFRLDIAHRPKKIDLNTDLTNLSLQNNCVDMVICWHILEHISKDRLAISEIFRVLKPGGIALISVPIYPVNRQDTFEDLNLLPREFIKNYGHADHVRSCGLDYYKRFEEIGFIVRELRVCNLSAASHLKEIEQFGLSRNHVVWCCLKT